MDWNSVYNKVSGRNRRRPLTKTRTELRSAIEEFRQEIGEYEVEQSKV